MVYSCAGHTAYIYDRGGANRLGQITPLTAVRWARLLDDISESLVRTAYPDEACAQLLADVQPGRHELVIFRGDERVWEGPITRLAYHAGYIEIAARDCGWYLYRTVMRSAYNNAYPNVQTCIQRTLNILNGELARKEALDPPVNVLPYVTTKTHVNDSKTTKSTIPHESTVFDDMDSLAQYAGMDYTFVGRRLILSDTHNVWGRTETMTEADFIGDVIITLYGTDLATEAWVLGMEDEKTGVTPVGHFGDDDPYYGEWEVLDTPYNEGGEESVTQAALDSQAKRNIAGKNPTPLMVRVPENSTINPFGVLRISDLVPGVRIPLSATLTLRKISQMQKLKEVHVSEEEGQGEMIQVTMNPASINDEDVVDE